MLRGEHDTSWIIKKKICWKYHLALLDSNTELRGWVHAGCWMGMYVQYEQMNECMNEGRYVECVRNGWMEGDEWMSDGWTMD